MFRPSFIDVYFPSAILRGGLVVVLLAAPSVSAPAVAGNTLLRSPFRTPGPALVSSAAAITCAEPPLAQRDLVAVRYYSDAAGTVEDPALRRQNDEALAPVRGYARELTRLTDRYRRFGGARVAGCALDWLDHWARSRALLGTTNGNQAEYERKWTLAALALNYLKIRDAVSLDTEKTRRVEHWLSELAAVVIRFHENPRRGRNNHLYWSGLAVTASGVAANDPRLFGWGVAVFHEALGQIRDDGTLPLELARKELALHYHNFAAAPLALIAEIGEANGIPLYDAGGGAFHRLVRRTLEGMRDPAYFQHLTGAAQRIPRGGVMAWLEPYAARFPSSPAARLAAELRPLGYDRLGGDLTLLFAAGG
jgi:poly(beta-D-mannuronate) lyase